MKKNITLLIALFILLSFVGCNKKQKTVSERDLLIGINAATFLSYHDYESLYVMFDIDTKEKNTLDQLREQLEFILKTYGEILEIDSLEVSGVYSSGKSIVYVPLRFASGWMNLQCTIQSSSIYDLSITVSDKIDEDGYNETRFSVNVDDFVIKATCTRPNVMNQNTRVIVLMHGKDAFDMNSTIGVNKLFKNLAYELADEGLVVIRYERVVNAYPIEDSITWIQRELEEVLSSIKTVDDLSSLPIYILGYDLGGYLLPRIASEIVCDGYIICSAMSSPLADFMYQARIRELKEKNITDSMEYEQVDAMISMIHSLQSPEDYLYNIFGYSSDFWLSLQDYNPIDLLETMPAKTLVTSGSNDFEINVSEYNAWKRAKNPTSTITYKYFKNMTHLLSISDSPSSYSSYYQEAIITPALIKEIVRFVREK